MFPHRRRPETCTDQSIALLLRERWDQKFRKKPASKELKKDSFVSFLQKHNRRKYQKQDWRARFHGPDAWRMCLTHEKFEIEKSD
jgi:hypothetical protein